MREALDSVWTSFGQDGPGDGVFARRYDRRGNPLGAGEFRVNGFTVTNQTDPSAAFDGQGGLVIAWVSQQNAFAAAFSGSVTNKEDRR